MVYGVMDGVHGRSRFGAAGAAAVALYTMLPALCVLAAVAYAGYMAGAGVTFLGVSPQALLAITVVVAAAAAGAFCMMLRREESELCRAATIVFSMVAVTVLVLGMDVLRGV